MTSLTTRIEEVLENLNPGFDHASATLAITTLFAEELERLAVEVEGWKSKKPRCYCREYSMGEHSCDESSDDAFGLVIALIRSKAKI